MGHAPTRRIRLAAHWRYKEAGEGAPPAISMRTWVGCGRSLTGNKRPRTRSDFLDWLRGEISRAEVYVFTPRGKVLAFPQGATAVDFAYAVHTEVGHKTIGAGQWEARATRLDSRQRRHRRDPD